MHGDLKMNILIRGPILTQSGYGEHARFLWRALKSDTKFEIYVEPTTWGTTAWLWEDNTERRMIDADVAKCAVYKSQNGQFDVAFIVSIPNEWERLAPITIGVTAGIETTKVAPQWIWKANSVVDSIIVPSEFSKKVFEETVYPIQEKETGNNTALKLKTPISVIHYPVKEYEYKELDLDLKYDFNFLVVSMWGARKNIENTIKWFVEEFHDDEVGLVLKTNKTRNCVTDRILTEKEIKELLGKYPERKCKIHLLHGYLNHDELHSLYKHPKIKALINLSHGEGFGLPLFEAAYCGLPVISHDFGGQKDFLHMPKKEKNGKTKLRPFYSRVVYELKDVQKKAVWDGVIQADSQWAFINEQSAKIAMREMVDQYSLHAGKAKKLKKWVDKNFVEKKQYKEIHEKILGSISLPPKDFNGVSFCISTNASKVEKTKIAIKALKNQITTKEIEIVLVGQVEDFKDMEDIKFVDATEEAKNGFLPKMRNIGAENSSLDVICYLDDDMILPPNWLWRLEEYSASEGWDVLGNKIFNPDGSRLWDRATINPHILVSYAHPETDKNLYQTGGFWVTRRTVFKKHQWDGTIPLYAEEHGKVNEDIEYSRRLHHNGYIFKFDAQNVVWHWDNGYTQVQLSDGNSQTLKKEVIEQHSGPQQFPPICDEFKNLMMMLGQRVE